MSLSEELSRVAALAAAFSEPEEEVAGVLATEPAEGRRVYLCAYRRAGEDRSWLALDGEGRRVASRTVVREAVSIAAMCELAEESAAAGDLDQLRSQLSSLRLTENPPGIDAAEEAVEALQRTIAAPPRLATPPYLDAVGAATRRLERALEGEAESPFGVAMKLGMAAVEALTEEVEAHYKGELS